MRAKRARTGPDPEDKTPARLPPATTPDSAQRSVPAWRRMPQGLCAAWRAMKANLGARLKCVSAGLRAPTKTCCPDCAPQCSSAFRKTVSTRRSDMP